MSVKAMERVAVYLNHRGMTWDQLSMLTHISEQRLNDLASGRQGHLLMNEAKRICKAIKADLGDIFEDHAPPLDPVDIVRADLCNRIGNQIGPEEVLRRLTHPSFKIESRPPCRCGSSQRPA